MKKTAIYTVLFFCFLLSCPTVSAQESIDSASIIYDLKSSDQTVRQEALLRLQDISAKESVQLLPDIIGAIPVTIDFDARVDIKNAIRFLRDKISKDKNLIPDVANLLNKANLEISYKEQICYEVESILTEIGSESVPSLLEIIQTHSKPSLARNWAARIISQMDDLSDDQLDTLDKLLNDMSETNELVKFWLAVGLANNKKESDNIFAQLYYRLKNSPNNSFIREKAAMAIEKMGNFFYTDPNVIFQAFETESERFNNARKNYDENAKELQKKYPNNKFKLIYKEEVTDSNVAYDLARIAKVRATLIKILARTGYDKSVVSSKLFEMIGEKPFAIRTHSPDNTWSFYVDFGCSGSNINNKMCEGIYANVLPAFASVGEVAVPQISSNYQEILELKPRKFEDVPKQINLLIAIYHIGEPAKAVLPLLLEDAFYEQQGSFIRELSVKALGTVGASDPKIVIPKLKDIYKSRKLNLDVQAAQSLEQIALRLSQTYRIDLINILKDANKELSTNDRPEVRKSFATIEEFIGKLNDKWRQEKIINPLLENIKYLVPILFLLILLLICLFIYWYRPIYLFKINQKITDLPFEYQLPSFLNFLNIPLRYGLIVGFFYYSPRVLNAWIKENLENIGTKFEEKKTVKERETHILLPAKIGEKEFNPLTFSDLKDSFTKTTSYLTIIGDGGSGKTSLACSIAKCGYEKDKEKRLGERFMMPIFVEQSSNLSADGKDNVIEKLAKEQVKQYTGLVKLPSSVLTRKLAERKLLLFVIDGFSEMGDSICSKIKDDLTDLSANAVILTMRSNEKLRKETLEIFAPVDVNPLKIGGKILSVFLHEYIERKKQKAESKKKTFPKFEADDIHNMCRHLSLLTTDKETTVLFVKLFADLRISAELKEAENHLPRNIPELIFYYINELNREFKDKISNKSVRTTAKVIAWYCWKNTLKPQLEENRRNDFGQLFAKTSEVEKQLKEFAGQGKEFSAIEHLKKLNLVNIREVDDDEIRFTLEPLSEYLGSLYLMETFSKNDRDWYRFFEEIKSDEKNFEKKRSFIYALQNCCSTKYSNEISSFVPKEISELAGVDLEYQGDKTEKKRMNQILQDLSLIDMNDLLTIREEISILEKQSLRQAEV